MVWIALFELVYWTTLVLIRKQVDSVESQRIQL